MPIKKKLLIPGTVVRCDFGIRCEYIGKLARYISAWTARGCQEMEEQTKFNNIESSMFRYFKTWDAIRYSSICRKLDISIYRKFDVFVDRNFDIPKLSVTYTEDATYRYTGIFDATYQVPIYRNFRCDIPGIDISEFQ